MSPGIVRYTFNRTFLSNREREDSAFLRERSIDNACLVSITPLDSRLGSIRTRFVSAPYQFQACETRSFSVPHSNNRVFFLRERSKDSREHGYPIERERESTLPLCCQGEISVEIWDSTFASIHVKFSWERKFTSRRFQIRLEGLRITWLREKVFSWPVDKLLDGRSRGRGSWQESGLKSYLTISSNAWIMEIESVGLYLQEGIIRRMLLGGENSRVSSTIPSGGRTRSLFDLTIVDWNCITRSANGFKFYSFRVKTDPIIQFPYYYVRVINLKISIHIITNVLVIFQCKYQKIFTS